MSRNLKLVGQADKRSSKQRRRHRNLHLALVMPPLQGLLSGFSNALVSLANYVRLNQPCVNVHLLNLAEVSSEDLHERLLELPVQSNDALVIGITTTTASYQSALSTARIAKATFPQCTVLFGGHHVTADAENVLQSHPSVVDYAILGEGERSLVDFLDAYPEVKEVRGVAYIDDNARFVKNAPAQLLGREELDELPGTCGEDTEYGSTGKFQYEITYVSARGCPLACDFCAVGRQLIRHKSTPQIVEDIRDLVRTGYRRIAIEDNFFAHSRARTKKLCEQLATLKAEGLEFQWDCQTRVESLNDDTVIKHMAEAGCEAVFIGVESLSYDLLEYLNKTNDPARYIRLLEQSVVPSLLTSPIVCNINLQFGIPGTSQQHRKELLSRLASLGKKAQDADQEIVVYPQLHVVYPGTQHFMDGVARGRFAPDVFETFTMWEMHQQPILTWLGEHFAHGVGGLPEGILRPEPLRSSVFEVDADAVMEISTTLRKAEETAGVQLFKYGQHLVKSSKQADSSAASTTQAQNPVACVS